MLHIIRKIMVTGTIDNNVISMYLQDCSFSRFTSVRINTDVKNVNIVNFKNENKYIIIIIIIIKFL